VEIEEVDIKLIGIIIENQNINAFNMIDLRILFSPKTFI
jgi:hypothetical protein